MNKPIKPSPTINIKQDARVYTVKDMLDILERTKKLPNEIEIRVYEGYANAIWYEQKNNPDYDYYMKKYEENLQKYKDELKKLLEDADKENE